MAFEDVEAEIGILVGHMQNQPADTREIYLLIRQKLSELRAYGMPLPHDLLQLERRLEAEFERKTWFQSEGAGPVGKSRMRGE